MDILENLGVMSVIAVILAIVATVLAFIFIVPEKKRDSMGAFGKFLNDTVNFKYLIIEKILQALYIFATANTILVGFFALFLTVPTGYDYYTGTYRQTWVGWAGLLIMVLGPILVRLVYELLMMTILLVKNVISINSKLKSQTDAKHEDIFTAPDISGITADIQQRTAARREAAQASAQNQTYAQPQTFAQPQSFAQPQTTVTDTQQQVNAQPQASFCSNCGTRLDITGVCPNCGNK